MIDFEKIKEFYNIKSDIGIEDIQPLFQVMKQRTFEANDYLSKEGFSKREVFFIQKGLIRAFIVNDKGDEITTQLRWEKQIFSNIDTILFNQPSRFYCQALEKTSIFSIDYDVLESIIAKNHKLSNNRKFIFQYILKDCLQRIDSFILLTPEERYLEFIESKPDIANRVPDKYIAHVLGITPVSLSRIRKRIASKRR